MDADNNTEFRRETSKPLAKRQEPLELRVPPAADIYETDDAFAVKLDMPGAVKESLKVHLEPGYLSAGAEIARFNRDDARLLFGEIGRKIYFREFNLGNGVNHDEAQAEYEDGVLTITLPKTDKNKTREITIK